MASFILATQGSGGDVFPFLHIGSRLKARGHEVTLLTHCHYRGPAEAAGLNFNALDSPGEYSRFLADEPLLNTPSGVAEFFRRHSLPKILTEYNLIQERHRVDRTVLVARDLFDTAARIAAEKLRMRLLHIFFAPSQLETWKIRVELFMHTLAADINRLRACVNLLPVGDWSSWLTYSDCSLALWPDWFAAPSSSWPTRLRPVGFMAESEPEDEELSYEVQAMISDGPPPVLVTGGTGTYLGSEFYEVAAHACQLLGRRAILVIPHDQQVPKYLPDLVRRFRYLQFSKLVPRVAAIIHHGGRGTLSCAIAAGIPQLVLAMGADRPDNAMRLQSVGVASYLPPPRWKPSLVAAALGRLLESSRVKNRCRELADRVRNCDAVTAACDVIEGCVRSPGQGGADAKQVIVAGGGS